MSCAIDLPHVPHTNSVLRPALVSYMFSAGPEPPCSDDGVYPETDINGDHAGPDTSDLVYLVT